MLELFLMLVIHWVADFILQSDVNAKGKSSSWRCLMSHTIIYSACWMIPAFIYGGYITDWINEAGVSTFITALVFVIITFIAHTTTDYITSREVKKLFDKQDYHNGFVVIGLDQILHYTQLILTYLFLFGDGLRINI